MKAPSRQLFLAHRHYRQRRMMDAARLLPLLGFFLFVLPVVWASYGEGVRTAPAGLYLFGIWFGLIALAFGLAWGLAPVTEGTAPKEDDG